MAHGPRFGVVEYLTRIELLRQVQWVSRWVSYHAAFVALHLGGELPYELSDYLDIG